jgi:Nucleotidyl transferase AbiEii toxin, Type IV TA system
MLGMTMNLQARIDRYRERGIPEPDVQVLLLIEESAVALFNSFPDHFVLFGGVTLVLFHDSPRVSRDLDLLSPPGQPPGAEEIQKVVHTAIQPFAEVLGLGQIEFKQDIATAGLTRQWVLANQEPLFSIDLTTIGGGVLKSQILPHTIAGIPDKTVLAPTANYLLFQKCETFLSRRFVKARDAFDIHLLLSRRAALDKTLRAHFEDFLSINEFDAEFIAARIRSITPKLCTVELRPVLPPSAFEELEKQDFLPIHSSLRTIFADWLEESSR